MQINSIAVLLTAVLDISQALSINHTGTTSAVDKVKIFEDGLPPPLPPRPAPRPPKEPYLSLFDNANDEAWEKAKCRGANFMRAMRGSDRDAGQVFEPPRDSAASEFENLDFEAAERWGWGYSEGTRSGDFKDWGMDHVLRDLGLADKCYGWGGSLDCLTFVHGFEQLKDGGWEFDPSTYDVNGRTYRRSGAHYGIAFDAQKGVILALDRNSPQSAGKALKPPVEGDELPAIRASSDIMWLYWKMYNNAKGPNYFISLSITNTATQNIISRAIREVIPEALSFPAWGGYDFDTDTPEGQALLGTPNAQAFSYFLLQHKSTLGNLYISEVRVFRDNRKKPGPNLLFVVEPVPANNDTKTPTEEYEDIPSMFARMKRHQNTADVVRITAKSPADLPAPKPLIVFPKPVPDLFSKDPQPTYLDLYPSAADREWDSAKCKGTNFVGAMRGSDAEAGKIFNPPRDSAAGLYDENNLDDLSIWGWSGQEATEPGMRHYGVDHVLRDMGASDTLLAEGGDIRLVSFKHGYPRPGDHGEWITIEQQDYEVAGKKYRYTGAWYNFALDEINGVMIATDRMSPQEMGRNALPTIEGDDLPLIRAFSDMAWISWAALADRAESDVKNIHYFMSLSVTNELTQRILSRCIREALPGAWGFPDWPGLEFETSTPQGQAILGTPNAQAFSYFLLQHKKELGNLHISRIRVFHDSNWIAHANILLVVEPVSADADAGVSAKKPEEIAVLEMEGQGRVALINRHLRRLWHWAKL